MFLNHIHYVIVPIPSFSKPFTKATKELQDYFLSARKKIDLIIFGSYQGVGKKGGIWVRKSLGRKKLYRHTSLLSLQFKVAFLLIKYLKSNTFPGLSFTSFFLLALIVLPEPGYCEREEYCVVKDYCRYSSGHRVKELNQSDSYKLYLTASVYHII